ncbi:MAG: glycosyl transferase, partial [Oscillospiraceae bacterium]|nr:glycosyl transferase [Oscillospiraceae bacterium]
EENAASMAACLRRVCRSPEQMKQIGEGALRDLYISWDTAVKTAVERYRIVIENYRAGRYPKHERPRDELLNGIGELMNAIGTGDARRKELRSRLSSALEENLEEFYDIFL